MRIRQDIPDLVRGCVGTRGVGTAWPLHTRGHAVWLSWLTEERQGQKYLDTCQVKKQAVQGVNISFWMISCGTGLLRCILPNYSWFEIRFTEISLTESALVWGREGRKYSISPRAGGGWHKVIPTQVQGHPPCARALQTHEMRAHGGGEDRP